ncbi:MAG: cytochrome c peroxidase [Bacteroidia bacterium]
MKKITLFLLSISALIFASATVDLTNLFQYANQQKPAYILKDNTPGTNAITNAGATLGRVLFYDKKLSLNNTVACASCHVQQFAFGDTAVLSRGINGELTVRHSMRLINARFGNEQRFFWNERAANLEQQTTQPIQDHVEMGFSGLNGNPGFDSLLRKINNLDYYKKLLKFVYGKDTVFNELMVQRNLAQFVRSIQSFDSKYDIGRALVNNDNQPFPNFTAEENLGKQLFLQPPPQGGAGCQGCHRAPEFDIDPASRNNGIIGVAGSTAIDLNNTRSPSLRDLFNPNGNLNGPLMHNGIFTNINQVINHYNIIPNPPANTNLDPRLTPGGQPQRLNLTQAQREALIAFLQTLTGNDVYTNPKWSNPFDENGNIEIKDVSTFISNYDAEILKIYPNPVNDVLFIEAKQQSYNLFIYNIKGQQLLNTQINGNSKINVSELPKGILLLQLFEHNKLVMSKKFIKSE